MATQTVTMPQEMQACQLIEFNQPHQIKTIPTPSAKDLKPFDVLLKVAVPALCHSDLEYQKGVFPITLPVTASHEGTGTVVACGSSVTRFQAGDRVLAGQTFGRCGDCAICNGPENYRHYCPNREVMMSVGGRNGAFQEYLVVDGREATKIPDKMSFATAAPLACAGMTSWRAVKQARLEKGEWLGIIGSGGGLGHLAIQFAKKAFGLKVVGVDARDSGLDLSRDSGADLVVDARKGKDAMVEDVMKATGTGVNSVLELSGHPSAAETGVAITRNHGRFVQVAIADKLPIDVLQLIFKDLTIGASFMASQVETEEMLHAVVDYGIHVENNIFHGLDEIPRVVEMLKKAEYRGKACFVVDKDAVGVVPGDGRV